MRFSRLLGILVFVLWLLAILSVALPIYSASQLRLVGTPRQGPGPNSCTLTYSIDIHNGGFLPLNDVYGNLSFSVQGTRILSAGAGPVNIPPGSTVTIDVNFPNISASVPSPTATSNCPSELLGLVGAQSADLLGRFTTNLGGLIPIAASVEATVPLNSSGGIPFLGGNGSASLPGGVP